MSNCCANPGICCAKHVPDQQAALIIALAGNPNCGKTTLFNLLTGSSQRVGNWPGVTVERKSGFLMQAGKKTEVIDLPGLYSITMPAESAIDECIACQFILHQQADVFVNIVDASRLERHLYLTIQLLEMGVPVILALNMMDVARAQGKQIDIARLSQQLGCPVVTLEAHKGTGLHQLKQYVVQQSKKTTRLQVPYPDVITQSACRLEAGNDALAIRLLEDDGYAQGLVDAAMLETVKTEQTVIREAMNEDADILIADARYQFIQQLVQDCVRLGAVKEVNWTSRFDKLVLSRIFGIPIFLGIMYCLFFFAINIGGVFQDFFDIGSQTLFVDGLAVLLNHWGLPGWFTALFANGIGKGISTTLTFIPVIGAMFLFLALLEDSGYMARAAFVVDRLMRAIGLPGKAFVPMIVGFGCNVPAVMAARTLENKRDRILTIMMSPFMSCGARLAIYAVFAGAFFPQGGQNIVFALYIIGILIAMMTGFILRKTLLKGDPAPLLMELPDYHLPRLHSLFLHAWQRLKGFVFRAGKLIIPICVLIGMLNSLNIDGTLNGGEGDMQSLLSLFGHAMTPVFAPMGIQTDNWPATVGLLTGVLAKEVVIGTLNTLYAQAGHLSAAGVADFHFLAGIQAALQSIPDNIAALGESLSNPVLAKAPIQQVDQSVYGVMYQRFDGRIGAFAYLLFILLYFPCISTMAAMLRELHRGWAIFSACWTTGVAYAIAVIFYQAATWSRHPFSSLMWILGLMIAFFGTIAMVYWLANQHERNLPLPEPEMA